MMNYEEKYVIRAHSNSVLNVIFIKNTSVLAVPRDGINPTCAPLVRPCAPRPLHYPVAWCASPGAFTRSLERRTSSEQTITPFDVSPRRLEEKPPQAGLFMLTHFPLMSARWNLRDPRRQKRTVPPQCPMVSSQLNSSRNPLHGGMAASVPHKSPTGDIKCLRALPLFMWRASASLWMSHPLLVFSPQSKPLY